MPKMSPENRRFRRTSKCPRCGRFLLLHMFLVPDGDNAPRRVFLLVGPSAHRSAIAACQRCGGTWPLWASQQSAPTTEATVRIREHGRTAEPIGDDVQEVNNSASSITSTRRLQITRRWRQACEIQAEGTHTSTQGITLSAGTLAKFTATAEEAVKRHYSVTTEEEQTFSEEIEYTIPARTTTEVRLHWKRLWQEGRVTVTTYDGAVPTTISAPFRLVLGVTFDQESRDL